MWGRWGAGGGGACACVGCLNVEKEVKTANQKNDLLPLLNT